MSNDNARVEQRADAQKVERSVEYLFGGVSIILGLGITKILTGVGHLMENWEAAQLYWIHCVWVVALFTLMIQFFWVWWRIRPENVGFGTFQIILSGPVLLYLMSELAFPSTGYSVSIDLQAHYYHVHQWFFALAALYITIGILITRLRILTPRAIAPRTAELIRLLGLITVVIAAITSDPAFHSILACGGILLVVSFVAAVTNEIITVDHEHEESPLPEPSTTLE